MRKKQHFIFADRIGLWQAVFMKSIDEGRVSARERQVMDILFRKSKATAEDVMNEMPDPPGYSAVRALLATLEAKGMVKHGKESRKYVYQPAVPEKRAKRSALNRLLATFFEGRPEKLVAALLDPNDQKLSHEEIEKIRKLIDDNQA